MKIWSPEIYDNYKENETAHSFILFSFLFWDYKHMTLLKTIVTFCAIICDTDISVAYSTATGESIFDFIHCRMYKILLC